ncbi:hypothetical protein VJ786_14495 [Sphingobacterium sp. PU5-4]|uniref:Uncharacterized protein n=1 Tax=Sphingobacterium tenebrionis TaxID=3111775 RepID=A0ABU8I8P7_9SPHI
MLPSLQNHGESNAKVCFSYGQHPFPCFFPASILLQIRTKWVPEQNMFPYQQANIHKWDKIPPVQTYPAPQDINLSTIATALYTVTVKNVPRGSWKYGWEVPIFAPLRKGGTAGWPLK